MKKELARARERTTATLASVLLLFQGVHERRPERVTMREARVTVVPLPPLSGATFVRNRSGKKKLKLPGTKMLASITVALLPGSTCLQNGQGTTTLEGSQDLA